jgi:hypothetical protein
METIVVKENDMDDKYIDRKQNTTKYGEAVPTMHGWLPPEKQKRKAEKLDEITKND